MCVSVCLPPRLLISSGMIWTPYDWLNKFYSCNMAAVVDVISRGGLSIEESRTNKPYKTNTIKTLPCFQ